MKQLTRTLNALFISTIFLGTMSVHSMENSYNNYTQKALLAEKYNDTVCLLTHLPNEKLIDIFSFCLADDVDQVKSLEKSIKSFMRINMVCRNFNRLLTFETVGKLCKNYALDDKNYALRSLMRRTSAPDYKKSRLPMLILICAHASTTNKVNSYSTLLSTAVIEDDVPFVTTLFKHHVDPNEILFCTSNPTFFSVKTMKMAQLFIDNGVKIHSTNSNATNVLWAMVNHEYPSELMEFYLMHHVDATKLTPYSNSCLLHALGKSTFRYYRTMNLDDFLRKATLLLNAIPNMVNKLDRYGNTPLDNAQKSLEKSKKYNDFPEAFEKLIALYRKHGCLAGKELPQPDILVTQSTQENDMRKKYI